jgi:peptide deformylase
MIKVINVEGNPTLKQQSIDCKTTNGSLMGPVTGKDLKVWDQCTIEVVTDLKDTAESVSDKCLGLASNQVWDKTSPPLSVFVVRVLDSTGNGWEWKEFINPTVNGTGKKYKSEEGCLSYPDQKPKKVTRRKNVEISYYSLDDAEQRRSMKLYGNLTYLPTIIQHEYDHIQGRTI